MYGSLTKLSFGTTARVKRVFDLFTQLLRRYFSKVSTCPMDEVSLFENITVRNLAVDRIAGNGPAYTIVGLPVTTRTDDNGPVPIRGVVLENITVAHYGSAGECVYANVTAKNIIPPLSRGAGCGAQEVRCMVNTSSARCFDDSKTRGLGMQFQATVHDRTTLERCAAVRETYMFRKASALVC